MNFHPQNVTIDANPRAKRPVRRQRIVLALISGVIVLAVAGFLLIEYFDLCATKDPSPILCTDPCELPQFSGMPGPSV